MLNLGDLSQRSHLVEKYWVNARVRAGMSLGELYDSATDCYMYFTSMEK